MADANNVEWWLHCIDIVTQGGIVLFFPVAGICLITWLKPYVERKRTAYLAGLWNCIVAVFLWVLTGEGGVVVHAAVMLAVLLFLLLAEKKRPRQKIFLCVMFLTLRFLGSAMYSEYGFLSLRLHVFDTLYAGASPPQMLILYGIDWLCSIIVYFLILYLMVFLLRRVYRRREELTTQELLLLLIPTLSPLFVRGILNTYFGVYGEGIAAGYIRENIPPSASRFLYYLLAYLAILAVVWLYENVKRKQEEAAQGKLLEQELKELRRHIAQAGERYAELRALRHEIGNHLIAIERLTARGDTKETAAYVMRLKEEYRDSIDGVRSGHPVTDVVLTEKKYAAKERGISFICAFHYPEEMSADAFDLSVVINNALDNAIRGAATVIDGAYVKITSSMREHFFLIVVTNSYAGDTLIFGADGLPLTSKEGEGHGIGLHLIQSIARKYTGEAQLMQREGAVELRVLMQL